MQQYMKFIESTGFGHLLHLVGSLPYTMPTMHSHMNIKFQYFMFIFKHYLNFCSRLESSMMQCQWSKLYTPNTWTANYTTCICIIHGESDWLKHVRSVTNKIFEQCTLLELLH
jgi:hypothetical protein